ncbi:hypothetical protein Lesp01_50120 [Lentzea sp. NBRC 102530]|nr:hypothetical protein Lesp01_50120 [Lentzea sp. NBRC 102530]
MDTANTTTGQGRRKPFDAAKAVAHTASSTPEAISTTQYIGTTVPEKPATGRYDPVTWLPAWKTCWS